MAAIATSRSENTADIWLPEIIMIICRELARKPRLRSTQRSLASVALVNKTAWSIARNTLYNHIDISNMEQSFELLRTLMEEPNLAARVRCISVTFPSPGEDPDEDELHTMALPVTYYGAGMLGKIPRTLFEVGMSESLQNRLLLGLLAREPCSLFAMLILLCPNIHDMDVNAMNLEHESTYITLLDVIELHGAKLQNLKHVRWTERFSGYTLSSLVDGLFPSPSLCTLSMMGGHSLDSDWSFPVAKSLRRLEIFLHCESEDWAIFATLPNLIVLDVRWLPKIELTADWDEIGLHLPLQLQDLSIRMYPHDRMTIELHGDDVHRGRLTLEGMPRLSRLALPLEALANPEGATGREYTDTPWTTTADMQAELLKALPSLVDVLPESLEELSIRVSDTPGLKAAYLDKSLLQLATSKKQPRLNIIQVGRHTPTAPSGWRVEYHADHENNIMTRHRSTSTQPALVSWPWEDKWCYESERMVMVDRA